MSSNTNSPQFHITNIHNSALVEAVSPSTPAVAVSLSSSGDETAPLQFVDSLGTVFKLVPDGSTYNCVRVQQEGQSVQVTPMDPLKEAEQKLFKQRVQEEKAARHKTSTVESCKKALQVLTIAQERYTKILNLEKEAIANAEKEKVALEELEAEFKRLSLEKKRSDIETAREAAKAAFDAQMAALDAENETLS